MWSLVSATQLYQQCSNSLLSLQITGIHWYMSRDSGRAPRNALLLWRTSGSILFIRQTPLALCLRGGGRAGSCHARSLFSGLARRVDDRTMFPLMTSRSGDSGLPQSNLPVRTPQSPLLQEPSTAMGQVLCESVIRLIRRVLVYRSNSPQLRLRALTSPSSIVHSWPYPNHTTIIPVCVDSFIQVVASWTMMLTLSHLHML